MRDDEENKEALILEFDQSSAMDEHGIYMFYGDVHPKNTFNLIDFILRHNLQNTEIDHLSIIINSGGGYVNESAAVVDIIRTSKIPIWTYGIGQVSSAACDILGAGVKGHRYLYPHTMLMTHQWSSQASLGGKNNSKTIKKYEEITNKIVKDLIKQSTNLSDELIEENILTDYENFLSAEEAIALGFADHLIDGFPFV